MAAGRAHHRPERIGVSVRGPHSLLNEAISALLAGLPGFRVSVADPDPAAQILLIVFPGRPDAGCVAELRRTHRPSALVCVSAHCTPADAIATLQAGATGCLSSQIRSDELAAALRQAARGEIALSADLAQQVIAHIADIHEPGNRSTQLTPREEEILQLVCEGMANKEIGQRLYLSVRTVENHLLSIYTRLGVRNRTEAAVAALQLKTDRKNP